MGDFAPQRKKSEKGKGGKLHARRNSKGGGREDSGEIGSNVANGSRMLGEDDWHCLALRQAVR